MLNSRRSLAVAAASVSLLALLAGCSMDVPTPGPATSAGPTSGTGGDTATADPSKSDKTYAADDLVAILKAAEPTVGTGKIYDSSELKSVTNRLGAEGINEFLKNGRLQPAACGTLLATQVQTSPVPSGNVAALKSGNVLLSVAAADDAPLPADLRSNLTARVDDLTITCSHMKLSMDIVGFKGTIQINLAKVAAVTDAEETAAFTEESSVPNATTKTHITIIQAVKGNLLITATGLTGTDVSTLQNAVNAAVAAAG